MKCPVDNTPLQITTRSNIEIDYCPQCRGIWLDRGELDKLIERSRLDDGQRARGDSLSDPQSSKRKREWDGEVDDVYESERRYERSSDDDYQKPRKKRSFFEDLFDFD